jgi:hypothetical protein
MFEGRQTLATAVTQTAVNTIEKTFSTPFRRVSKTPLLVAVVLFWTACTPSFPTISPVGLSAIDRGVVEGWVNELSLKQHRLIRIRPWRYTNDRGSASGRAVVRLVEPDSMRFDFRAPFGKSGAAVIVNDHALWAHPEGDFGPLIRIAPVFWSALGHPLTPPPAVELFGMVTGTERVWQYGYMGDTLTFIAEGNPVIRLRGEMRRDGKTFALSTLLYDSTTGLPIEATVDFPMDPGRFKFEIQAIEDGATFEADIWDEP